jgi:uncharacterized protein (AIM24 family)
MERIVCGWCQGQNDEGTKACQFCGAPMDATKKVTDSGWTEVPRLRDLAEFRFSGSVCQVDGEIVPVVEMNLAPGDSVFFDYHTMLFKEPAVPMESRQLASGGAFKRIAAGMPRYLSWASGPGRIAFSRDAMGEIVVLPLHPSMEIDVRNHSFVVASHSITYSFVQLPGMSNIMHGGAGAGMYLDRFVTTGEQGIVVLHGYGNVFSRTLAPGETILVEPGGFLYKDSSVTMTMQKQDVKTSTMRSNLYLAELVGPGRVGIQSMYHHHAG